MSIRRLILSIGILLSAMTGLRAQNVTDLIISEVMLTDSTSIVNGYGEHCTWLELLNTSQGAVNFGGCYFSDDRNNLTKSPILKGDKRTVLGARQVTLLYATDKPGRGAFYFNFLPKPGSTVYLVSNDGRTIIDSLAIPVGIVPGTSISKFAVDAKAMRFEDIRNAEPTPGTINGGQNVKSKAERIKETDPHGFTLTIVSVSVVFLGLFVLFLIYNFSGKCFSGQIRFRNPFKRKAGKNVKAAPQDEVAAAIAMALQAERGGGEVEAAIATALHLYLSSSLHDEEPYVITIRPVAGESAWREKSRNFRKLPR